MPKCSTRPYQSAVKSSVEIDGGPNDFTSLMVVLLLPARSAEPPHNSGSFGATSLSTWPNAARVASGLEPGSQYVRSASQPSGSSWASSRSSSFLRSGSRSAHASNSGCHFSWASGRGPPACGCASMTSSRTSNFLSGSKPSTFLVAATSSAPSADPCTPPVFIFVGAG